jgi:hypothetical protein
MLQVLAATQTAPLAHTLPKELTLLLQPYAPPLSPILALPTHMLAVYAHALAPAGRRRVTLFPVHDIVLATHCANLPPLTRPAPALNSDPNPNSRSDSNTDPDPDPDPTPPAPSDPISLTVPVVPLCLPSPETFPHLSAYLYTKRTDLLLTALLPCPPPPTLLPAFASFPFLTPAPAQEQDSAPGPEALQQFAAHLGTTYTPAALLRALGRVGGVWRNMCALGVYEAGLWGAVEGAWEVLVCAMGVGCGVPT